MQVLYTQHGVSDYRVRIAAHCACAPATMSAAMPTTTWFIVSRVSGSVALPVASAGSAEALLLGTAELLDHAELDQTLLLDHAGLDQTELLDHAGLDQELEDGSQLLEGGSQLLLGLQVVVGVHCGVQLVVGEGLQVVVGGGGGGLQVLVGVGDHVVLGASQVEEVVSPPPEPPSLYHQVP